ncbi:MAG TPA: hypothetical protein PKG60_05975 [Spirochaetota bacterium]|nr:hypothetical protein [Spirochaetota bacterium]HPS87123.1 hypothetical protein [Spirochaetota bacterium]
MQVFQHVSCIDKGSCNNREYYCIAGKRRIMTGHSLFTGGFNLSYDIIQGAVIAYYF